MIFLVDGDPGIFLISQEPGAPPAPELEESYDSMSDWIPLFMPVECAIAERQKKQREAIRARVRDKDLDELLVLLIAIDDAL